MQIFRWSLMHVVLLTASLLGAHAEDAGEDAKPSEAAQIFLSEDFFPGLHILDVPTDSWSLVAFKGGQLPGMNKPFKDGLRPKELVIPQQWKKLRVMLQQALDIPPREEMQTRWAIFDRLGGKIETVEALREAEVAFVQEIGVWVWPAVRVGFKQEIPGVAGGTATITTLALRPKIFEVKNFLSVNETEKIMDLGAQQGLFSSKGVMQSADIAKGTADAEFRTSKQAWLHRNLDPLIGELDGRVAALTRVPESHQETVQLLRYDSGKYYHNHMDWAELELYPDQQRLWIDGYMGWQDRLATVFWYLNDVPEGGETNFPKHNQPICEPLEKGGPKRRSCPGAYDPPANKCDVGFKVKPQRGSVVLWYNYHSSGRGDVNSLHAGCPVGEGLVKWSANKWVRIKPQYGPGFEKPRWVEDHPALDRFAWKGAEKKKQSADSNECEIGFENAHSETVDIMWHGDDEDVSLGDLDAGAKRNMNSFKNHWFFLQTKGGRSSNHIKCKGSLTLTRLNANFKLEKVGQPEL